MWDNALSPRAYLDRMRYAGAVDLAAPQPSIRVLRDVHEAHLLAVPFENLSIHYGEPIRLEEAALYEKIVQRQRGGFCYELNGLFAWLLRQVGFSVTLLSARVAEPDGAFSPKFDHLALLIHQVDGDDWLADVGFGDSFLQPLHMRPDVAQDGGDGHMYQLRHDTSDGSWFLLQEGAPQYRFTLRPHVLADFTDRCAFQQTSPDSHFTQRRICTLALPDGRITLSERRLITTRDGQREERELPSEEAYRETLVTRFNIRL